MEIIGVDFTSSPSQRKPITAVYCALEDSILRFRILEKWVEFEQFELALRSSGPWIMAIDFPFGQARRFIETIGWPQEWAGYVIAAHNLGRSAFRDALDTYRVSRRKGDKEHRRATDKIAGSISPQKLYGVPVGLMFFEGAPRLLKSGVNIPYIIEGDPNRTVVEAYPGVIARSLIGRQSYKADDKKKQTEEQRTARIKIFDKLVAEGLNRFGFRIQADQQICEDAGADSLDALICAVQAAWAWKRRGSGFGAPRELDRLEGWIVIPTTDSGPD